MAPLWLLAATLAATAPQPGAALPPAASCLSMPPQQRLQLAQALAEDNSAGGFVSLWLLAHDAHEEVVAAALHSALARCPRESRGVCTALLRFFVDDDEPRSWRARSAMLVEAPHVAIEHASKATKLEVVALLAGKLNQAAAPAGLYRALRLLAEDEEQDVQEAAGAVLLGMER